MRSERFPELSPDLKPFEAALSALVPSGGTVNRDALMYRAGWAAGNDAGGSAVGGSAMGGSATGGNASALAGSNRRGRLDWLWPLTTAGLVVLSATLGMVLATRQPEVVVVQATTPDHSARATKKEMVNVSPGTAPKLNDSVRAVESASSMAFLHRPNASMGQEYLSMRDRVLAFGVDSLPSYSANSLSDESPTSGDSRYGALINQLRGG